MYLPDSIYDTVNGPLVVHNGRSLHVPARDFAPVKLRKKYR